ncbi:MAG: hypothetical protein KAJ06_10970, partial [Gammaproteobacteria bacterium]|nr:hypothetical protein [Gammaproteobacteria bacterium]
SVTKTQVGLSNVVNTKVKLDATIAPTVNDDSNAGYSIQSRWSNITADTEYVCLDATVGAAVWTETTGAAAATHDLGGVSHNADTLANLNSKISDATLVDTGDSRFSDERDPTAHATEHVDGTDDIRNATNTLKGLATSTQITNLESNTTHRTSDGSDHSFIDQSVVIGSAPALLGTNVTAIPSTNVDFLKIGTPTYYTAQHWFDVVQSSGIIDGFEITAGDDITHIDISAGKGVIKIIDSELGTTKSFEIGTTNELALTPLSVNYIYLDYNAGSPIVAATTDHSIIELNRMFDLGVVYSNTSSLHILSAGVHISNLARSEYDRLIETVGFTYASGAAVTNSSLDLIITAGVWYYGHNRLTTDALDTTGIDTFQAIHYGTSSWITDDGTASAINATKYNDGDDVLGDLTANAYGVQWLYVTSDSDYYVVYGTENGTLAAAEAAVP